MIVLVVVGGVALVTLAVVVWGMGLYNALVALREGVDKAWADVDVLLKQRRDEIPKLVAICEGYMKHERETLERVAEARARSAAARGVRESADAEGGLVAALGQLFAVAEQYPDLKAHQQFGALQRRVSSLEDQIADRRELYNAACNNWNVRIQQVPDLFVANLLGARVRDLYRADARDREDVKISFGG